VAEWFVPGRLSPQYLTVLSLVFQPRHDVCLINRKQDGARMLCNPSLSGLPQGNEMDEVTERGYHILLNPGQDKVGLSSIFANIHLIAFSPMSVLAFSPPNAKAYFLPPK
jgi:hypothetical protein